MIYLKVKYCDKKEIGNNELELSINQYEDMIIDVYGKEKQLLQGFQAVGQINFEDLDVDVDFIKKYIRDWGLDAEDVGIDISDDEDEIISDYFQCKILNDFIDDQYTMRDVKEFVEDSIVGHTNRKGEFIIPKYDIFDFISEDKLKSHLDSLGFTLTKKEE